MASRRTAADGATAVTAMSFGSAAERAAQLDLEQRTTLARRWVPVERSAALDGPGAFRTLELGGAPIAVVRGEDGDVHGFVNACVHRGACVLREA
ncbi:MAG: Rieske 2Fe-2S domain-containing protein, partial [Planctomycetota bacterium]